MRLPGRRSSVALGCGLSLVAIAALAARSPRQAEPPEALRDEAERLRAEALAAGAERWANTALDAASRGWSYATREAHVQSQRSGWRRDYTEAARAFAAVRVNAATALRLTRSRAEAAGRDAAAAIDAAQAVLDLAERMSEATALPSRARSELASAALDLTRARQLQRSGELLGAVERARQASARAARALEEPMLRAHRYAEADLVRRWQTDVDAARSWSRTSGRAALVVIKDEHRLLLFEDGREVRRYAAELGKDALAPKHREGDTATPEGRYHVTVLKDRGQSKYHRALLLDYPNADDRRRFAERQARGELPRGARIGSLIEIHGEGGRGRNWTDGCVALDNGDMDDLFRRVGVGTPVTIVGSLGSEGVFTTLAAEWRSLDQEPR